MDLKRSNPGSFCENRNLGIPPTPISPLPDLELETNEFHHDPGLKMCFLKVIFDINEIVFIVPGQIVILEAMIPLNTGLQYPREKMGLF